MKNLRVWSLIVLATCLAGSLSIEAETISLNQAKSKQWVTCETGAAVAGIANGTLSKSLIGGLGSNFGAKKSDKLATAAAVAAGMEAGCKLASSFSKDETKSVATNEQAAITSSTGTSETVWQDDTGNVKSVVSESESTIVQEAPDAECRTVTTKYNGFSRRDSSSSMSKQVYCADDDGQFKEAGLVL